MSDKEIKLNQSDEQTDYEVVISRLSDDQCLYVGDRLYSPNKAYYAELTEKGILNYYLSMNPPYLLANVFNTQTASNCRLRMQTDGNLVLYKWVQTDPENKNIGYEDGAIWASNTNGNNGSTLEISNTGEFAIIASNRNTLLRCWNKEYHPEAFYRNKKIRNPFLLPGQIGLVKNLSKILIGNAKTPYNKIGVLAINEIFKGSNPSTSLLNQDFTLVMQQAFQAEHLQDADIKSSKVIDSLNSSEYKNYSSSDKEAFLSKQFGPKSDADSLWNYVELLKNDYNTTVFDNNIVNVSVYSIFPTLLKCVNLIISIQQERAKINNPETPNETVMAIDLVSYLKSFVSKDDNNTPWIDDPINRFNGESNTNYQKHSTKVSKVKTDRFVEPGTYNTLYKIHFDDKDNGYTDSTDAYKWNKKDEQNAIAVRRETYMNIIEFRKECDKQLANTISESKENWLEIIKNPVPNT
ncbi:hypothetical protein [Sunxiuqinia elliptica]|uniref:D-mannose binding lectin n=1 Tax=Sunxiuqinia elliptica TaxID=655355 RepID=A0A4R6GLX6_9BACT|nr:hypothetical protein [Sunxiuqinia elliptica]TDN95394.1 D-mannose binding lectin [Sunxiuqinia elliptica]TDO66876.1 D-mannose binding lectin [Sunxiuqinia elliptica]